jgi:ribonuclease R
MSLVDDQTVRSALSDAFLRCLPKAVYAPDEIGHFGLSLDYYAQLTSPIRRLPDLINEYIFHMICDLEKEPENYVTILDMYESLVELGKSTSAQEKRADQLERDTNKMKFAEYMEKHIGEVYKVKISGFSKNGIFVQLPNTIEGMIPFKFINSDQFTYDDNRKVAIGKRTGEVFTLGTPLEVSVRRASKSESQIDFALIRRLDQGKSASDDRKKKTRR